MAEVYCLFDVRGCTGWIHAPVRCLTRKPRRRRQIPTRQRRRPDAYRAGTSLCVFMTFFLVFEPGNGSPTATNVVVVVVVVVAVFVVIRFSKY